MKKLEEATRKQRRMIRKLDLEQLVPLNVSPEQVDSKMLDLLLNKKITTGTYSIYHRSIARQHHAYELTVLGTLGNILFNH